MSNFENQARLVAQGRMRAIGVAWTDEELELLKSGKESAASLRGETDAPKAPKADEIVVTDEAKKLLLLKRDDLVLKAEELGVEIEADATKAEIVDAILKAPAAN